MQRGIIPHFFGIVNGRLECAFSRIISVLPGEENGDFNLNASYYIIIGTGENPGMIHVNCMIDNNIHIL